MTTKKKTTNKKTKAVVKKKPVEKKNEPKPKKQSKKQVEFLERRRDTIYQCSLIMLSMMSATRWIYSLTEADYRNKRSIEALNGMGDYLDDIQELESFENVYQGMLNLLDGDGYHGLHDVLLEAINIHKMLPKEGD